MGRTCGLYLLVAGLLGGLRIWLMGQRAALVDISIMLDGALVRVGPSPGKVGDGDAARRSCRAVPADSRGACVRAVMAHRKVRQVQMTRLDLHHWIAWRGTISRQDPNCVRIISHFFRPADGSHQPRQWSLIYATFIDKEHLVNYRITSEP